MLHRKTKLLITSPARVLAYVDKVNISFLGSGCYTTSKIPPHGTAASICLSNSSRMCMACRRTAQLSFPAEIRLPARRKQIVYKDSLRRSQRIPPFSQTECFSCLLFNSWRCYFVFLQTETFYFLTSILAACSAAVTASSYGW